MADIKVTVVGGGVVGCAIAYELSRDLGDQVCLLERNPKLLGDNQSSRNSGVIHAGIYYSKESEPLKAELCVEGNRLLYDFCEEHGVPYKKTGKLVAVTNLREEKYLDDVLENALNNKVLGVRKISGREAKSWEPNIEARSALYVPTSGIVEATELVRKLCWLIKSNEAHILLGNEVVGITPKGKKYQIMTRSRNTTVVFETEIVINAAGLYSDEIARMINPKSPYEIDPVRGESAKFYKTKRKGILMNGLNVYPTPYGYYNNTGKKAEVSLEEFNKLLEEGAVTKTVGVHLTPTFDFINGEYVIGKTVTIGPTKTVGLGKENYGSYLKSEEDYLSGIKHFFPNLKIEDIQLHQTGIMAVLKEHSDFVIEPDVKFPNCINLVGIDSPGLTASLAIAKYVKEILKG